MGDDLKAKYNLRSPSVKRLMREAMELREANNQYHAQPLEDNLFEWHFTVRGPPDSDFDSGRYHGRIILPPEYPMKPPSIILLTPNGRFEIGKKICLSMSAHHPETWQPSWSIRTVLLALIGFMPTKGGGAIGALDYTKQERNRLALRSAEWTCDVCGYCNQDLLPEVDVVENDANDKEAKELASQIDFKGESKGENNETPGKAASNASPEANNIPTNFGQGQPFPNPYANFYNQGYFQYTTPPPLGFVPPTGFNLTTPSVPEGVNKTANNVPTGAKQVEPTTGHGSLQATNQSGTTGETAHNAIEQNSLSIDAKDQKDATTTEEQNTSMSNEGSVPASQPRQRTVGSRNIRSIPSAGVERMPTRRPRNEGNGYFSLVMLWIVTISLVALILRRLCMEAMNLNPQG